MLFNENFLWVHTPKTAGMSLQSFLVKNFAGEKIYIVTKSRDNDLRELSKLDRNIEHIYGGRHLNIEKSLEIYKSVFSFDPKVILTIIRDPVDLISSYYHHLLKPEVLKIRGMTDSNMWGHPKAAREMNLDEFASKPKIFYGLDDNNLMKYYECDESLKINIVPITSLNEFLSKFKYLRTNRDVLEKRNSSHKTSYIVREETKLSIYRNYPKYSEKFDEIYSNFQLS